jgi:putative ABC transport system permease protein
MISSYKKLTVKYLKANKKRSLLTIIGIILSVALIACIGLFINGIQETEIGMIKTECGSFHIMYTDVNEDLISKITSNPKVSRIGLFEKDEEIQISKNVKLAPIVVTNKALDLTPYSIEKGRMSQNKNEVAIENWILPYVNKTAKVGDKINIDGKEVKLVGILNDTMEDQIEGGGAVLSISNNIDMKKAVLLVEISKKTNLKTAVTELKNMTDRNNVTLNSDLINIEGGGEKNASDISRLYPTLAVIIGIVVIATIAVIYNSFQISVVDRIKQFGLLRAVGMTPKQLRKMVLKEATILAVIGIPIGLILGVVAIRVIIIVFKLIGADSVINMQISISPFVLIISTLVGVISVYLSAMLPTIFTGRISPLIAINGRTSIAKEKIKKRKSFIFAKIFKFEGQLAIKNIRRNKTRYRITVFSIVISVVLFVTFKSFVDTWVNVSENVNESKNINFIVIGNDLEGQRGIDDKTIDKIGTLSSVKRVYRTYMNYDFIGRISTNQEIKSIKAMGNTIYETENVNGKENALIRGYVNIYDDNSLNISKQYLSGGDINKEELNKENGVILIEKNTFSDDRAKLYDEPIANMKVGDEVEIKYSLQNTDELSMQDGDIKKVKIMAIVKDDPLNFVGPQGDENGLKFITTEDVAKKLTGINDIKPYELNIEIKNIKDEEKAKNQIEEAIKDNPSLRLENLLDENRKSKAVKLMIEILIYGFVVVVSLIGSVNIINTLTTNIILRKKEFAALKAIGLTQKGLRKMIVLEGLLYGIIGTIYGSIISCILSRLIYRGMNGVRGISWSVPWMAILIAGAASIIIGYLSVLPPLSRINKENLIEAIREDY